MRSRLMAGIAAVVLAVFGTVIAAGTVVQAQHGHGGGRFGGGPFGFGFGRAPGMEMLRQLDLSDQQKEQIRGIVQSHRSDFQQVREKMHAAREAQRTAAEATPPDEATIRAKATEIASAEADLIVLASKVRAEVFQVLTSEQQTKANELKAQREQRRQEWQQKMQERRQQKQTAPPAQ